MFEISFCINRIQHVAVEAILEDLGAVSISLSATENDPIFIQQVNETPLWEHSTLTALFEQEIDIENLRNTLENVLACAIEISIRCVDNQDWQTSWKQGFQPLQFGERLWVCPSWHTFPDPFAINLRLDPGIAFGTGTHPTTALCLEWLANHPPRNKRVIDFGCGSGILAIAAYYLDADSVLAIDHDPQAIQATSDNAECNHILKDKFKVIRASNLPVESCELLLANLLLNPHIQHESTFANALVPAGKIILSGILQSQFEELSKLYSIRFKIDEIYSKNEWLLVEATRH